MRPVLLDTAKPVFFDALLYRPIRAASWESCRYSWLHVQWRFVGVSTAFSRTPCPLSRSVRSILSVKGVHRLQAAERADGLAPVAFPHGFHPDAQGSRAERNAHQLIWVHAHAKQCRLHAFSPDHNS